MTDLKSKLEALNLSSEVAKEAIADDILTCIDASGFTIVEEDTTRPWGAFFRLDNKNSDEFVGTFFSDMNVGDARLGKADIELSPKILLVSPAERLSWQYHNRRAELWKFINTGGYHRSLTDEQGDLVRSNPGDIVQFKTSERHRLVGDTAHYTLVAEIWQHTDTEKASDEADIIRVQDDYKR